MYDIPILFIIFRRKDVALQSFERIRRVQPSKLYIACDGARANVKGEKELVESTRKAIIDSIDWDCEVYTKFQTENLGCGIGVYTAINWFFNNEEEGIILEEDCVANSSFFIYVKELLERYGNDERIGMIAGTNPIKNIYMHDSYCFSKYAACWGWATWRRSWKNMKLNLDFLNEHKKDVLLNRGFIGKDVSRWAYQLKLINNNRVSAWDWLYLIP